VFVGEKERGCGGVEERVQLGMVCTSWVNIEMMLRGCGDWEVGVCRE